MIKLIKCSVLQLNVASPEFYMRRAYIRMNFSHMNMKGKSGINRYCLLLLCGAQLLLNASSFITFCFQLLRNDASLKNLILLNFKIKLTMKFHFPYRHETNSRR